MGGDGFAMEIQEMTARECRSMLTGARVARLACARNNQPYVVPVHVDLDDDFLYGFATLGQKIEWMRENPLVCLEIDELTSFGKWASVVVFGRYEELPDASEYEGSRNVALRLFERHAAWWEPASVPLDGHPQRPPIVFRIRIDRVTGRIAAPDAVRPAPVPGRASEAQRPRRLAEILRRVLGRP
jgi:uncharacterized protein